MTNQEQRRFVEQFMARRTSRVVSAQNGFNDVMATMQFDAGDAYVHDTQADTADDSTAAPTDTTKGSDNDNQWDGIVPGGSNDDTAVTGALDVLQKHIEGLGNADILAAWASTSDALRKTVSSGASQASPNADGVTREPLVVNDNDSSSHAGSHGYIPTSELAKMESEAVRLTKMTSKVVLYSGDKL